MLEATMKAGKEQRRSEAEERNAKWAALSFDKQIAYLDNMFGKDLGAAKQRLKIAKQKEIAANASVKKTKKKA